MKVTSVEIRRVQSGEGKVKAICSVVFDEMFVVHDLRVVEGIKGVFVAMPQRKSAEGKYQDIAHPITAEAREAIQKAVLHAYTATDGTVSATA